MLLDRVVEIIEFTDSDHLSEALITFNEQGIVPDSKLPFLNIVFEKAPGQLCNRLSALGFKGQLDVLAVSLSTDLKQFVIFDTNRFNIEQAKQWFTAHS